MTISEELVEFAGGTYGREGVAPQLLALQDRQGLDVLLLLCTFWIAQRDLGLSGEAWQQLCQFHAPVREGVIAPLRQARRAAAEQPRLAEEYKQLKALEVAIEFRQLEALAQQSIALGKRSAGDVRLELQRCCEAQGVNVDTALDAMLTSLIDAVREPLR